jgi:uncharacterized membrane protein YsdA (DUF1294 family)
MNAIYIYLIIINLFSALAFYFDKKAAKWGGWRTPEATLLFLALLGGSPASYIMGKILRHKTRKQPFKGIFYFIIFAQIITLGIASDYDKFWKIVDYKINF